MTMTADTLAVWRSSAGVPERVVWEGVRYRVTDIATPLDMNIAPVTRLAFMPTGWRFQGTSDSGESLVFDVVSVGAGQSWRVINTYK
jgi:hypothetical protein